MTFSNERSGVHNSRGVRNPKGARTPQGMSELATHHRVYLVNSSVDLELFDN